MESGLLRSMLRVLGILASSLDRNMFLEKLLSRSTSIAAITAQEFSGAV